MFSQPRPTPNSPYILIGQNDADISDDELIRGQDYQELFSNLAFATTFLTGVFLKIDVINADGQIDIHKHAIFNGIGFTAQRNGGALV